jgi:hypothetical protein
MGVSSGTGGRERDRQRIPQFDRLAGERRWHSLL